MKWKTEKAQNAEDKRNGDGLVWKCDKCGDIPYRPYRLKMIGMGCCCGGTYNRVAAMPNVES